MKVEEFRSGGYFIVLQAVDRDSLDTANDFAANFNKALPSEAQPLIVHNEYQDWASIQDLYRHASAALSSRLHSGVLGLSVARPTLYYAKNSKYIDLMGSINLRSMLINPTSFESKRKDDVDAGVDELGLYLAGRLAESIRDSPKTKSRLEKIQGEMMRDYERALEGLFQKLQEQDRVRFESTLCCKSIRVTRSAVTNARRNQVLIEIKCMDGTKDKEDTGDDELCLGS